MCGIAGFIDASADPEVRRLSVERMCTAMRHRGPDDAAGATHGQTTLGMCRLAIFDPARGRQPMHTPDGRFEAVFNGAIYNFRELRAQLTGLGHRFRTECDTEVLLAAFAQWGDGCLSRFRGMFAFAIWDTREETLFLARDPLGIKPLYYAHSGKRLLFASELQALIQSGEVPTDVCPRAVSDSLAYLAVPAPRTFYRAVHSLRPGECAVWRNGELGVRAYWRFDYAAQAAHRACATRADFLVELRGRLTDSIRAHCLADVPVGAFLSGGVDSSAVVGLMSREAGAQLKTFSIGFSEAEYSEAAEAAAAAAHFGTQHQQFVLTGERVANDIETLLTAMDQPTGDAVNTYYASQVAREGGVKVALSGLGGDELFGGYPSFRTTPRLRRLVPLWRGLPGTLRGRILAYLRSGDARRDKLADMLEYGSDFQALAALQRRNVSVQARTGLLREPGEFIPHSELPHLRAELAGVGPFSVISAWELRTYMADVLLRDSDIMSMRHSLELRVPFVDRPLIEWLWSQPDHYKRSGGRNKAALTEALADVLPPGTDSRAKRGFTLPFARWLRGPLKPFLEETFAAPSVNRSGFFNTDAVRGRWQAFLTGDDPREWSRIWSLAILIAFMNRRRLARS